MSTILRVFGGLCLALAAFSLGAAMLYGEPWGAFVTTMPFLIPLFVSGLMFLATAEVLVLLRGIRDAIRSHPQAIEALKERAGG